MKNDLKIPGCEYWGTYKGYDVYRCYDKNVPTSTYTNVVFAIGDKLFMNGGCVGKVDKDGMVYNWAPEAWVKEVPKTSAAVVAVATTNMDVSAGANEILSGSWKRSVEDLVGERFSVEYKYSE